MHADLFAEQSEELLRLLGAFGCEDLVELVGEAGDEAERVVGSSFPRLLRRLYLE